MPLLALIFPFLLWPLEHILPYPHIIEELLKAGIVLLILRTKLDSLAQFKHVLLFGGLFALSETAFYMINIMFVGNISTLLLRVIVTTPLHILTLLIIWLATSYHKWLILLGIGVAILIHYLFNLLQGL